jgi:hypothetical protein
MEIRFVHFSLRILQQPGGKGSPELAQKSNSAISNSVTCLVVPQLLQKVVALEGLGTIR